MKTQNGPTNESLSTGVSGPDNILCGLTAGGIQLAEGQMSTTLDASYLADNVLMLRYFEHDGEVKQDTAVFKRRGSMHERTIGQFPRLLDGLRVGAGLRDFRAILTGVPVHRGTSNASGDETGVR